MVWGGEKSQTLTDSIKFLLVYSHRTSLFFYCLFLNIFYECAYVFKMEGWIIDCDPEVMF